MKLEPVTKLNKASKTVSKKFDDIVILENCDVLPFFQFTVNLQQSGSWIPDT